LVPIRIKIAVLALATVLGLAGWKGLNALIERGSPRPASASREGQDMSPKVKKSEKEWKAALTPEQFDVMRKCCTERPFTGRYNDLGQRRLCLRRLQPPVPLGDEVRARHGLAQLHDACRREELEYRDDYSLLAKRVESAARLAPTWATFSMTAPNPRSSIIASTRPPWI
jgi:hypothetical protein